METSSTFKFHRKGVLPLNINIDENLRNLLDECAREEERTLRSVVERALRHELKRKRRAS